MLLVALSLSLSRLRLVPGVRGGSISAHYEKPSTAVFPSAFRFYKNKRHPIFLAHCGGELLIEFLALTQLNSKKERFAHFRCCTYQ